MPWYQMTSMKAEKKVEILIYDQIGEDWFGDGVQAKKFAEELRDLGDIETIELRINSPGGSVWDGNAIYNTLRGHKATVNVTIDGLAASIASVIAMSGDTITMPENALMMIHNPATIAFGEAEEMRKAANMLDKIKLGAMAAYHRKSGVSTDELSEMMDAETWLLAEDAVSLGFADATEGAVHATNSVAIKSFDMTKFTHVPDSLGAKTKASPSAGVKQKEIPMTLDELRKKHPELCQQLIDEGKAKGADEAKAQIDSAATEATAKETDRVKSVKDQLIPGHEEVIETLMFDGKTTGPEAAVQVLAAEKGVRAQMLKDNGEDAPGAVAQPSTDGDTGGNDANLSLEDRCKKAWDKDEKLRKEFKNFSTYLALVKVEGEEV